MTIDGSKTVQALIRHFPYTEDVLRWHGIDVDDDIAPMSVDAACELFQADREQVLSDLEDVLEVTAGELVWPADVSWHGHLHVGPGEDAVVIPDEPYDDGWLDDELQPDVDFLEIHV
ncbi:MAG: hypothetical protein ACQEXJ_13080 [Myxococcota bacterium]